MEQSAEGACITKTQLMSDDLYLSTGILKQLLRFVDF